MARREILAPLKRAQLAPVIDSRKKIMEDRSMNAAASMLRGALHHDPQIAFNNCAKKLSIYTTTYVLNL